MGESLLVNAIGGDYAVTGREFGKKIQELRNLAGLNVRTVARATDTSPAWISYVERGQRVPSWPFVLSIVSFFDRQGMPSRHLKELQSIGQRLILEKAFQT